MLLADELVERRAAADAPRERGVRRPLALGSGIGEEVAHAAPVCSAAMSRRTDGLRRHADPSPATAPSDYERYLNTDELLALQKAPTSGSTATSSSSRSCTSPRSSG